MAGSNGIQAGPDIDRGFDTALPRSIASGDQTVELTAPDFRHQGCLWILPDRSGMELTTLTLHNGCPSNTVATGSDFGNAETQLEDLASGHIGQLTRGRRRRLRRHACAATGKPEDKRERNPHLRPGCYPISHIGRLDYGRPQCG